jgi:hypothetical protein
MTHLLDILLDLVELPLVDLGAVLGVWLKGVSHLPAGAMIHSRDCAWLRPVKGLVTYVGHTVV